MPRIVVLLSLLIALLPVSLLADDAAEKVELRSLDDQVQEIKSDVLSIAAELEVLEERLLYPSNSQIAVFVALGEGDFRLDAMRLGINDELAAHHIYSFKELEALKAGGVQRLYMGNLPAGTHALEVSVLGKLANGREYTREERFSFEKGIEPSLLGITLDPASGRAPIQLKDW